MVSPSPCFFLVLFLLLFTPSVAKATDQTDITVGLKTLPLLNNRFSGSVPIAVVYDAAIPDSRADAETIKSLIDGGITAPGSLKLYGFLVNVSDLSKIASAKVVFLTKGLPPSAYGAIKTAVISAGALSISTDLECVKNNQCVLGIVSKPRVEIYFSKEAADASGLGFSQAFIMLVRQI